MLTWILLLKQFSTMEVSDMTSDHVVAKLAEMGFEISLAAEAIEAVGPSFNNAVDYILTHSSKQNDNVSAPRKVSDSTKINSSSKRSLPTKCPFSQTRQTSITEALRSRSSTEKTRVDYLSGVTKPKPKILPHMNHQHSSQQDALIEFDFDQRVSSVLQKHFGFSSLKSFQKEALSAWAADQDCLVLAATGSGKSLCFQIPALLTGKVVVVISPLISLMHDQCLGLAKHGVSACFLGSGQPDDTIENKAMNGKYQIIYVCPETVGRLIQPLQRLAEIRGIALFAIDEAHCLSKWGHDFRPDYRRLSILRETFAVCKMEFLKFDIPIMALTATATLCVREDILQSLGMSQETKIVLTSFFRPNLQFSVRHSRCSKDSYERDFHELVEVYKRKTGAGKRKQGLLSLDHEKASCSSSNITNSEANNPCEGDLEDGTFDANGECHSTGENVLKALKGKQLSVELSAEYLEDDFDDLQPAADDFDDLQTADDFDITCGEFSGQLASNDQEVCKSAKLLQSPTNPEEMPTLVRGQLEQGPTIIYTPTRKETVAVSEFLCANGLKAAAYNAGLPKKHLRKVHQDFHANKVDIVVATIAFGMGIDKHNVRRIIHYGWPQSLEAYYQEAGRAGRDGKLSDCILYANIGRVPTLLPSHRSEEQTKHCYAMLSDCFNYGMNTCQCRAKILVEYFGEEFNGRSCTLCDVCVKGPPEQQNLKAEASVFLQVIDAYYRHLSSEVYHDDFLSGEYQKEGSSKSDVKPGLKLFISKAREQSKEFMAKYELWWKGLARVLEGKGFIREVEGKLRRVQIRCPELTRTGIRFLEAENEESFLVYPEADMLLHTSVGSFSTGLSEYGRGWADPQIREERLKKRRANRKPRKKRKRSKEFFVKLRKKYG